jgi:hypothetical protein
MEAFHDSEEFLRKAKQAAKRTGYDPTKLSLATDGVHKLTYDSPEGIRHFGRRDYGDFIWYSKDDPMIAEKKRKTFRLSHGKISKIYNLGKYSKNELAINILW